MSKDSPAAILYDESGLRTGVEDNSIRVAPDPVKVAIHSNATVTASGSQVLTGYGQTELVLFVNLTASPTGTDPTIQYSIQEVDPGDETTLIGNALTGAVLTAIGTEQLSFTTIRGGAVKVSWTVTGTSPSFGGVYTTVLAKQSATQVLGRGTGASYPDSQGTYPSPVAGAKSPLGVDEKGNLMVRGPITTDEGSFFDDFIFATPDDSWVFDVDGGSYSIVQSILVLTAGTASGSHVWVIREGDFGPMTTTAVMRIDVRQNSQKTSFGFTNDYPPGAPAVKRAVVTFDDTNPRLVHFSTYASSTQIEETDVTMPNGGHTAEWHRYTVEVGSGYVVLRIDDEVVSTHKRHIPGPYDTMGYGVTVDNEGVVTLATTVYVDSVAFRNHNTVEIAGHFTGDPLRVALEGNPSVHIHGEHSNIEVEHEGLHYGADGPNGVISGRELLAVADPEMRSSLNEILCELRKVTTYLEDFAGFRVNNEDIE